MYTPPNFDRPRSSWQHSSKPPEHSRSEGRGRQDSKSNPSGEVGMDPMEMLALATVVFLVTHYVSSTPLRSGLVAVLGENIYLGLYALVSLATLGWMIWAYVKAPYERLWVGDEFKVGAELQDWRKERMIGVDWQRFASVTSNVPFAAIIGGRNQFRFDEIGWGKVLAGLALYFVLAFLHPYLFGARPY